MKITKMIQTEYCDNNDSRETHKLHKEGNNVVCVQTKGPRFSGFFFFISFIYTGKYNLAIVAIFR